MLTGHLHPLLPMTDKGGVRKEEGGEKNPILPLMCEKAHGHGYIFFLGHS